MTTKLFERLVTKFSIKVTDLIKYLEISKATIYNYRNLENFSDIPKDKQYKIFYLFGKESEEELELVLDEADPDILAQYVRWAVTAPVKKVVVFFTSMWGSTRQMANEIVRGAQTVPGVEVKLIDIDATHDTTTVTELMDCASFACGTPTLNIGMMPSMARTLTYVKGLRPQGKKGFAFGSYGWGGQSIGQVENALKDCKVEICLDMQKILNTPNPKLLKDLQNAVMGLKEA